MDNHDNPESDASENQIEREREAFRIIAEATVKSANIEELCSMVLEGLVEVLGFEYGTIRLIEENDDSLFLIASVGMNGQKPDKRVPIGTVSETGYYVSQVAHSRIAIYIPNISDTDLVDPKKPRISSLGIKSLIVWPIISGSELLGVLSISATEAREIPDADKRFFETVAILFSTALKRMQAEQDVRKAESMQRGILTALHDTMIVVLDRQGKHTSYWGDPRLDDKYGWDNGLRSEFIIADVLISDDVEKWTKQIAEVFETGESRRGEYRARLPNGLFFYDVTLSPILDDDKVTQIVGFIRDITERKAVELELRNSHKDLELYATILKHDLSNDLQVVLTQSEAIQILRSEDRELTMLAEASRSSAKRMTRMLDLLEAPQETSDSSLVEAVERIAEEAEKAHPGMSVHISSTDSLRQRKTNIGRLLPAAISNLLRNSAKYAGNEPKIDIKIYIADDWLVIDIIDDGQGIPDSIRDRLFEPGVSTAGTGLGLHLCRRIIEGYGGTIDLISQEEVPTGAAFRIRLPK